MSEAIIFDALRTPRGCGRRTGALYEVKPVDLLGAALKALQKRNDLDTSQVEDLLIGCVTPTGDQGHNIAKAALLNAGWSQTVSGLQLNRFDTSGLEAVNLAAVKVRSGWESMIVAGGVESMSRVPPGSDGGALAFDPEVISHNLYIPQGIAADLIATMENFTREEADQYAFRSVQRASHARKHGFFSKTVIPIYDRNGLLLLSEDEPISSAGNMEELSQLPPAFAAMGSEGFDALALLKFPEIERICHIHTSGNSSAVVDGASLVLVGSREKGESLGLKARARVVAAANVGADPTLRLTGATPAAHKALNIAGMTPADIDLWECNESFAAVVLKFRKDLDLDPEKVNVNGGAIALGHPQGATGAMLLGALLDELERRDLSTGLVALSAGGGMGVATIIERV